VALRFHAFFLRAFGNSSQHFIKRSDLEG
jgi:hypothetical protein